MKMLISLIRCLILGSFCVANALWAQEEVPASLRVTVEPAAQLAVNHKVVSEGTLFQLELPPNKPALLRLSKPGYETVYRVVLPTSAERCYEAFRLKPVSTPVLFRCNVPAMVLCDGQELGTTPFSYFFREPKSYRIVYRAHGFEDHVIRLNLENGQPQVVDTTLSSDSATLNVTSIPSGATILLNGVTRGVTPSAFPRLKAGDHTVLLRMPGYHDYEEVVSLETAEQVNLSPKLRKLSATLNVASKPQGASVYVNGILHGQTPLSLPNLAEGSYVLRFVLPGYQTQVRSVLLKSGQTHTESCDLALEEGELRVQTQPGTVEVWVDGKRTVTTHPKEPNAFTSAEAVMRLPVGEHTLTFRANGYTEAKRQVMIRPTGNAPIQLRLEFAPDFEVQTASGVYRGVLVRQEENGAVTLELRPGFFRTFSKTEIRRARFWKAK